MNPLNFPVDPNYFLKRFFLIYIYIFFYTQIKSVRPHLVTFALQISNIKKQPVETSEEIKFSYKPSLLASLIKTSKFLTLIWSFSRNRLMDPTPRATLWSVTLLIIRMCEMLCTQWFFSNSPSGYNQQHCSGTMAVTIQALKPNRVSFDQILLIWILKSSNIFNLGKKHFCMIKTRKLRHCGKLEDLCLSEQTSKSLQA